MKTYFVYITTNPGKTVLYTGVTNNLSLRIQQHHANKGNKTTFAGKYFCYKLIYYEIFSAIKEAIEREKEIKGLTRKEKEALIKATNPRLNFINAF
ncbi:MAG TPA: GIY-YIG nuclease family protein [Cytophagales bacterium]|nr:GIY-YIG nuclease family protein [Cytophagales bacterium]